MKSNILTLGLILSTIFAVNAQEPNAPAFGKGLFNLVGKDSTWNSYAIFRRCPMG